VPGYVQGRSLLPLLADPEAAGRDALLYTYTFEPPYPTPSVHALVGERYKLIDYEGLPTTTSPTTPASSRTSPARRPTRPCARHSRPGSRPCGRRSKEWALGQSSDPRPAYRDPTTPRLAPPAQPDREDAVAAAGLGRLGVHGAREHDRAPERARPALAAVETRVLGIPKGARPRMPGGAAAQRHLEKSQSTIEITALSSRHVVMGR
jgi:hypothetical protein